MAKLVCHLEKNNRSKITSIERHNNRSVSDSKILFPNKTINNYFLISSNEDNLSKNIFLRVGRRENPHKSIRKDAVMLCEILISASSDFFEDLSNDKIKVFFSKSCKFLTERYSSENCIYAVVHLDEAVPHMHFGIIPMTYDNFLCAKKIFHRNELQQLQSLLPAYLNNLGFDVKNCNLKSEITYKNETTVPALDQAPYVSDKYESYIKQLEQENSCLKLEKIYIERKLRSFLEIINDNPSLEEVFYTKMAKNTSVRQV